MQLNDNWKIRKLRDVTKVDRPLGSGDVTYRWHVHVLSLGVFRLVVRCRARPGWNVPQGIRRSDGSLRSRGRKGRWQHL